MAAGPKNNFISLKDFGGGLYTSKNGTQIPDNCAQSIVNIEFDVENGIGIRRGYEDLSTGLSGTKAITSAHVFTQRDGTKIRIVSSDTFLWWYDSTNESWYKLLTGLTTGLKFGFADSNTTTEDRLFFGNGTENLSEWSGNITRLTAQVNATDTTINVADTSKFPSSGTIIYNGTEIAYSGKTATTFTVASAHASAGADDGVAEAVDDTTHSADPKGNILVIFQDRLGIVQTDTNLITLSTSGDHTDFSTDPELINIVEGAGNITGADVKDDRLVVFKTNAIIPIFIEQTGIATTTQFARIQPLIVAEDSGAEVFTAVHGADNGNIFFVSGNGGVKELDNVQAAEVRFKPLQLTAHIRPTIEDFDFSDAQTIQYDKKILVACKETSDSSFNDTVIMLDMRHPNQDNDFQWYATSIFTGWNVGAWFVDGANLFFGSSAEETKVYHAFQGFDDDTAIIPSLWKGKSLDFGEPFKKKKNLMYGVYGLIGENTNLEVRIDYDDGSLGSISDDIEGDGGSNSFSGEYLTDPISSAFGSDPYGFTAFGGVALSGDSDLLSFRVFKTLSNDVKPYEVSFSFLSDEDGSRWKIKAIGFDPKLQESIPKKRKF
jgi:hypothetical protein